MLYTLEKSSFKKTIGCINFLAHKIVSWVKNMLFEINLNEKNVD
jgi:hypothetical protein